jgi:hypothetical protein
MFNIHHGIMRLGSDIFHVNYLHLKQGNWKRRFQILIILYWTFNILFVISSIPILYRLCGPMVRVPGYRSRGPDSIPGSTRFPEK